MINFPIPTAVGEQFEDPASGNSWKWDGIAWIGIGATGPAGPQGPPGPTAVSADPDNNVTLGSDGLIYLNAKDTTAIFTFNYSALGPVLGDVPATPAVATCGWIDLPAGFTDVYCVSTFGTACQYDTTGQPTLQPYNLLAVEPGPGPVFGASATAYTSCSFNGIVNHYGDGVPLTTAASKSGLDPNVAYSVTVGSAKLAGGGAIRVQDVQLTVLAWNRSLI